MTKRIIFTCVILVMLAFSATSCKLPASGTPPTNPTSISGVPSATSGSIQAAPTNTAVPPTPVVVTSTSAPVTAAPTALPPTSTSTPIPPTPTAIPPANRIEFEAGGTGAVVNGEVDSGEVILYVLKALATQNMSLKVTSANADVYLGVFGADGQVFLTSASQDTLWEGTLPTTQDYYISLTAGDGRTSYSLSVEIPPLHAGPTANVTPVAGTFDPVATYGTADFEDSMNGSSINDWVNPVSGLLPDTRYLRITETDHHFYVRGKIAGFTTWYFTWRELTDFYLQSTFDSGTCADRDAYGLIIRGPAHLSGVSYGYVVTFSCAGDYKIFRLDSADPFTFDELVSWTRSDYIQAGSNKQNVMGIQAIGDKLTIFANGHQVAQVEDNKYAAGRYGVFVSPDVTDNYTYRVVQMSYWEIP